MWPFVTASIYANTNNCANKIKPESEARGLKIFDPCARKKVLNELLSKHIQDNAQ